MKRKIFFWLFALLSCSFAQAEYMEVDGIAYNSISDTEVEVTYRMYSGSYSGDIVIPETINDGVTEYTVTRICERAFFYSNGHMEEYSEEYIQGLTSVSIPSSVTSIGNEAFAECYDLTTVTFGTGSSLTTVGSYAFQGCGSLTSINLPDNLTSIGICAFSNCSSLTSPLTIPSSVTSIGGNAFENCSGLTSVTFETGSSLTTIGGFAFLGCSNLTSVTIPNSVTSIGSGAFQGCSNLTSINLPDNLTSINSVVFYECGKLSSITIPNSVTSIDNYAFYCCSGLTSITIPNTVASIGDCAFNGCHGLTSVTIPSSVTSISPSAFTYCSNLAIIEVDENNTVYDSRNNCNAIIQTADNIFVMGCKNSTIPNSVTSIGDQAFHGCSGLISVTIPDDVVSIGEHAFSGCNNLTSVNIPNTVTSIGFCAFYNCSKLTSIDIPNSVTSIGSSAFEGTAWYNNQPDGLIYINKIAYKYKGSMNEGTQIVIEEGTLKIANNAFSDTGYLTSVVIPNSVTDIGDYAFFNCRELNSATIGENVTSIGMEAFYDCEKLTSIAIPNSVTYMGDGVFQGCHGLTSVTIGENVTSIGDEAFCSCDALTSINIPNSVTSIGNRAFEGCLKLASVIMGRGVTSIGNFAFDNCEELTSVTMGNDVTSIGDYAFCNCLCLGSVTIPYKVTNIGKDAFCNCINLPSVTIPYNVTRIGEYAFTGCENLTFVRFVGDLPSTIADNAFSEVGSSSPIPLIVPEAYYSHYEDMYKSSYGGWNKFCRGVFSLQAATTPASSVSKCGVIYTYVAPNEEMDEHYKAVRVDTETAVKNGIGYYDLEILPAISAVDNGSGRDVPVTTIGDDAFQRSVTSIIIPNTIISIGVGAFRSCYKMTSFNMPNSVTSIGAQAFDMCYELASINIPNSVTTIGEGAFAYCQALKSVTIPNSITSISANAFYFCSGLEIVNIQNGVRQIGNHAFVDCTGLTYITIPKSVKQIGNEAFRGCTGLTSVKFDGYISVFYNVLQTEIINNDTFCDVGTPSAPVRMIVPTEYYSNYEAAFDNEGRYCSGYFTLYASEVNVTLAPAGYATYYNGIAPVQLPAQLSAVVVSGTENGTLTYTTVAKAGGVVPSGTAVVLCGPETDNPKSYTLNLTNSSATYTGSNMLHGSDVATTTTGGDVYYKLAYGSAIGHEDIFGWYWGAAGGAAYTSGSNKAWLALPAAGIKDFFGLPGMDNEDSIGDAVRPNDKERMANDAWYDMNGHRLNGKPSQKGVYINNGKKIVIE